MKQKSLLINSFYNSLYRVVNIIYPLITTAYISHVLQASGVGKVNFAQNIAQYFVLLAPLGIQNYGTREIAKVRTNYKQVNLIFSELFVLNFLSTLICSGVYYALICEVPKFRSDLTLYSIIGIQIIFNIFNIEWAYIAFEEYKFITIRNIIIKVISLALLPVLVKTSKDYIGYAVIYTLGIAGNYFLNILFLHKSNIHFSLKSINIRRHLKPVFVLFASIIAIELYTLLDTTMLGFIKGDEAVGFYTNSSKVSKILITLITSVSTIMLPRVSYYLENGQITEINKLIEKVQSIIFYLSIPTAAGLMLFSKNVVLILFGKSFLPAVSTLKISALLILVLGFSNLYGTQILVSFNAESKLLLSTIVGAIINFTMNSLLIPTYGPNGAIVASVFSEIIVLILTVYFASKFIKTQINIFEIIKIIIATAAMSLVIFIVKRIFTNLLLELLAGFVFAVVIYCVASYLLHIRTFIFIRNRIFHRKINYDKK